MNFTIREESRKSAEEECLGKRDRRCNYAMKKRDKRENEGKEENSICGRQEEGRQKCMVNYEWTENGGKRMEI